MEEEKEEVVPLPVDMQSLDSPELGEEEATPAMTEEVLLATPKGQTPFMICNGGAGCPGAPRGSDRTRVRQ